ncbi:MAG: carboxylate-amine ligase [Candidatus Dormibacteraeota bacterium]|uniref:Putative glutamate--cysteine ligase 2 n=1 Tax=Candidatus Dormiibacter inghamiae TaxID=3127013 RepID=A0A934NEA3_9BACT|nr:carboxylate-amine ligase [Candidatus Dormibacteraeota bacterium]MBJ7607238.1 carboxylate-amine ligase [Candidatus Dormibacteraeota bacterium]
MSTDWLTIGVEEEYQILDSDGHLQPFIDALMTSIAQEVGADQVRPEMIQSVVEVGTTICQTVGEAKEQLSRFRAMLNRVLEPVGMRIACAGTHPFSRWQDQQITEKERYKMLEDEMQDVVREILIFGLHVHVALPDPDRRMEIMNEARYFLPHLLALSTSSPFWDGRETGLKSYRSVIWSRFPRTGIPPDFSSYDEYENYIDMLVRTGCIDDGKRIWWDLRSHPHHPTLEWRCCDQTTRIEETVAIAGLCQAICAKLLRLRERNLGFRKYMPALIAENKWRAMRHGTAGKLIDFGRQSEIPTAQLAEELLEFIDEVVDELESREAVRYVETILREGTSADRQLRIYRETGSLKEVVENLCAETAGQPSLRHAAAQQAGD